jgi:hypothetical protein
MAGHSRSEAVACIGLQTAACGIGENVRMRWQAQGKSAKLHGASSRVADGIGPAPRPTPRLPSLAGSASMAMAEAERVGGGQNDMERELTCSVSRGPA